MSAATGRPLFEPEPSTVSLDKPEHITPELFIDEDVPESEELILRDYDALLQNRPALCLSALRRYVKSRDESQSMGTKWKQLTDVHFSMGFYFDEETEGFIADDPTIRRHRYSKAEDSGFQIRARRVEIYLERILAYRKLGREALK